MMTEPNIRINGTALTIAQTMTVRVSLGTFLIDLNETGLGDDEHGLKMTEAYKSCLTEIFSMIS